MPTTKALGILLLIIVIIGVFLALAGWLGIAEYWAGFLFLLQWSLMEEMKRERLAQSALGSAAGIAIASIPAWFAASIGLTPALALLTGAALLATFVLIKGWLPIAINNATMVFLTVATIPHITTGTTPGAVFLGLAAGVIYFGGLALTVAAVGKARAARPAPAA